MQILGEGTHTPSALNVAGDLYVIPSNARGVFVLTLDTVNMALGDIIELTVTARARPSSTEQQAYYVTYSHIQSDPIKSSVPVTMPAGGSFKFKQTAGTVRSFEWSLVQM